MIPTTSACADLGCRVDSLQVLVTETGHFSIGTMLYISNGFLLPIVKGLVPRYLSAAFTQRAIDFYYFFVHIHPCIHKEKGRTFLLSCLRSVKEFPVATKSLRHPFFFVALCLSGEKVAEGLI